MSPSRADAARRRHAALPIAPCLLAVMLLGACGLATPTPTSSAPGGTGEPTPTARPTPLPTLSFSNRPDPALVALIPTIVAGNTVQVPPITDFALTPGDIGQVYGEIGTRFRTLQLAFVEKPRLSLFAMRMDPPFATTAELEPYLAEAARYVGISGLHLEAWSLASIEGHRIWWRPEDNATLKGTRVYTWAADGLVFLMIGVDEAQNLAMLAALPGEPLPAPTPLPTGSGSPGASPAASGPQGAQPSAAAS
jgi:hypothetical protein